MSSLTLVLSSQNAAAQAPKPATPSQLNTLEQKLEEQQKMVEELRRQVEELRRATEQSQAEATAAQKQAEAARKEVAERPLVESGNPKLKLTISGQVARAVNVANDGRNTDAFFVDDDAATSQIRAVGKGQITDDLAFGTQVELGVHPNDSDIVSQTDEVADSADDTFEARRVEAWFDSQPYGRLWFGRGSMASDGAAEEDLSQTEVVMYSSIADIAGGLFFTGNQGPIGEAPNNVQVKNAFDVFDGKRESRARYDTPTFGGFQLSTAAGADQQYDTALTWGGQTSDFQAIAAVFAAHDNDNSGQKNRIGSSGSIVHLATGLNFTFAATERLSDERGNPSDLYFKAGWLAPLSSFGPTAFGVDFARSDNQPTPGDSGYSVGGAVVQHFDDYGIQAFLQVRDYTLDRDSNPKVDNIVVGSVGTVVKF